MQKAEARQLLARLGPVVALHVQRQYDGPWHALRKVRSPRVQPACTPCQAVQTCFPVRSFASTCWLSCL